MSRQEGFSRRATLSLPVLLAATWRMPTAGAQEGALVETAKGRLRGLVQGGSHAFRGIRYAAATGGTARFLPPGDVAPWTGTQDATAFGASAPQLRGAPEPLGHWYNAIERMDEDCLFLNVTTPRPDGARRPVMVWLHGGSWNTCAGTAPGFDGTALALEGDVVVVTLNHRLNLFGAINLGGDDPRFADSGNAGVLDMVAALRWVRENIPRLGGDPGNVTIFGQSGGAAKVAALMNLPAAKGLFQRAIVQSCSGGLRLSTPEESARQARELASRLDMPRADGAALQAVPFERLLEAMRSVPGMFRPVLDGRNVGRHPFDPDSTPVAAGVPLMIGNAATETTYFLAAVPGNFDLDRAEVLRRLRRWLGRDEAEVGRIYEAYQEADPTASPSDVLVSVSTDYNYRRNTMRLAALHAGSGAPVYAYVYDWKTPVRDGRLRSPHTVEVPFVFGTTKAASALLGMAPTCLCCRSKPCRAGRPSRAAGTRTIPGWHHGLATRPRPARR
ncbi:carboxylesterase/lipase family protein [Roseomonas sp. WA12]